jgi:hypothetical protein
MEKENQIQTTGENLNELIPQMNISPPAVPEENNCLIEDQALLGIYTEIMQDLRKDEKQVEWFIKRFADMVINGGDSSTSSKEALVNLLKIKTDMPDKKAKIADLMTRIKLKSPDTYKPYLNAKQENNTTINIAASKKDLLKRIQSAAKKKKEEKAE